MGIIGMVKGILKPKKTAADMKESYKYYTEVIAPAAFASGADLALRNYDIYRRISFWFFLCCAIVMGALKQYGFVVFFLTMLHIQIMFNQLWWKIIHLEKKQEEGNNQCTKNTRLSGSSAGAQPTR